MKSEFSARILACVSGVVTGLAGFGGGASAQVVRVEVTPPQIDRWMYPFNQNPGVETTIPTFGVIGIPGFDDRDSEMLVVFNTAAAGVPTGLALSQYHVGQVRLRATVANNNVWLYEPSVKANNDPDPKRPVELFGAGFRGPWNVFNFQNTTTFFGGACNPQPAQNCRSVFPAIFDSNGAAIDVSNQLKNNQSVQPFATGIADGLSTGDPVPEGTTLSFELNLCDPTVRAYVQRGFRDGRLFLLLSTLIPTSGGPGGGDGPYPRFYTRDNPLGTAPALFFDVRTGSPADVDGTGFVDSDDFVAFVNAFTRGCTGPGQSIFGIDPLCEFSADFDGSCFTDSDDFAAFVAAFQLG
jgi:hypothetical protein